MPTFPNDVNSSQEFIEELLRDARNVARYQRFVGHSSDGKLLEAIAEVESNTDNADIVAKHAAIIKLQLLLQESARLIPFSTLVELRRGWPPEPNKSPWKYLRKSTTTWILVLMSITLMGVVGQLTRVHGKGVYIANELKSLVEIEPRQKFNQLLRDVVLAREQIDSASSGNQVDEDQFELARAAYLSAEHELITLSDRVAQFDSMATNYTAYESRFPLWGMRTFYCLWHKNIFPVDNTKVKEFIEYCTHWQLGEQSDSLVGGIKAYTKQPLDPASPQQHTESARPPGDATDAPVLSSERATIQPQLELSASGAEQQPISSETVLNQASTESRADQQKTPEQCEAEVDAVVEAQSAKLKDAEEASVRVIDPAKTFRDYNTNVLLTAQRLACRRVIAFLPGTFPPINPQAAILSERISLYALWLLPALYGAMGAVMFHMRRVLNPLLPDPALTRLAHRIVLSALAGVVLSWFFIPDSRVGTEIADVGIALFALAFLFGFSLNVFFAMLDKLVQLAESGIDKLGSGGSQE